MQRERGHSLSGPLSCTLWTVAMRPDTSDTRHRRRCRRLMRLVGVGREPLVLRCCRVTPFVSLLRGAAFFPLWQRAPIHCHSE
jgi:hypothetical protein